MHRRLGRLTVLEVAKPAAPAPGDQTIGGQVLAR